MKQKFAKVKIFRPKCDIGLGTIIRLDLSGVTIFLSQSQIFIETFKNCFFKPTQQRSNYCFEKKAFKKNMEQRQDTAWEESSSLAQLTFQASLRCQQTNNQHWYSQMLNPNRGTAVRSRAQMFANDDTREQLR